MSWAEFFFGSVVGGLVGFLGAYGMANRFVEDLIAERDQERARAEAYLERMRRDDVRREDRPTVSEIEDEAGML